MIMDLASPQNPTPARSRWQFSLRQMFAAVTGIAILLGWAAWGGWLAGDAVVYLSIALLAAVFSRMARCCLVGACAIFIVIWTTGVWHSMEDVLDYVPSHYWFMFAVGQRTLWVSAFLLLCVAAFLRVRIRATACELIASLALAELLIAAKLVCVEASYLGCWTLPQALGFADTCGGDNELYRQASWSVLRDYFPRPGLFIAGPWLLGIVVGEIVASYREPSNSGEEIV